MKNRITKKRKLSIFYYLQIKPHPLVTRFTNYNRVITREPAFQQFVVDPRTPSPTVVYPARVTTLIARQRRNSMGLIIAAPRYSQIRTLISIVTRSSSPSSTISPWPPIKSKGWGGWRRGRKKEELEEDAVINPIASQEAGKNVGDLRFLGGRN